jgi:hypothetical protein
MEFSQKFAKRRYSLFPKTLANGLAAPIAESLKKRGFEHEAIMHYWADAVGNEIAACSCPVKFRPAQANRQSQLIVKISPAYSAIASHQSEQILQRLTQLLGYRPAERLIFITK